MFENGLVKNDVRFDCIYSFLGYTNRVVSRVFVCEEYTSVQKSRQNTFPRWEIPLESSLFSSSYNAGQMPAFLLVVYYGTCPGCSLFFLS